MKLFERHLHAGVLVLSQGQCDRGSERSVASCHSLLGTAAIPLETLHVRNTPHVQGATSMHSHQRKTTFRDTKTPLTPGSRGGAVLAGYCCTHSMTQKKGYTARKDKSWALLAV